MGGCFELRYLFIYVWPGGAGVPCIHATQPGKAAKVHHMTTASPAAPRLPKAACFYSSFECAGSIILSMISFFLFSLFLSFLNCPHICELLSVVMQVLRIPNLLPPVKEDAHFFIAVEVEQEGWIGQQRNNRSHVLSQTT